MSVYRYTAETRVTYKSFSTYMKLFVRERYYTTDARQTRPTSVHVKLTKKETAEALTRGLAPARFQRFQHCRAAPNSRTAGVTQTSPALPQTIKEISGSINQCQSIKEISF